MRVVQPRVDPLLNIIFRKTILTINIKNNVAAASNNSKTFEEITDSSEKWRIDENPVSMN
jgi:hypothetical protein